LQAAIDADADLTAAGFSVSATGGAVSFTNAKGESFQVRVAGDIDNTLGFGTAELDGSSAARYNTITSAYSAPAAGSTSTYSFLLEGAETTQTISVTVAASATAQDAVDEINAQIALNTTLSGAGLIASTAAGNITFETTTNGGGGNFLISANEDDTNPLLALNDAGAEAGIAAGGVADGGTETTSTSADPIAFTNLFYGNDVQNLTVNAKDDTGAVQSVNINLTHANANTVDDAVASINAQLQASNNSTLQQIVAVKERDAAGSEGIRFLASLTNGFSIGVGDLANDHGVANDTGSGDTLLHTSAALAGGSVSDISSKENAGNAVTLLATAVVRLGIIQADVGRGQNRLQFAIGLATTQITNISAAESRIRDADLAAEAANLTRTSIAQQAGVAALAQANSAPQAVLALLRG
jgi:flagellin